MVLWLTCWGVLTGCQDTSSSACALTESPAEHYSHTHMTLCIRRCMIVLTCLVHAFYTKTGLWSVNS